LSREFSHCVRCTPYANKMGVEPFSVIKKSVSVPLIANIPHSSIYIPPLIKRSFVLNDDDLQRELLKMTDRYIDELFSCVHDIGGISVIYNYSRLVVDPERFEDDEKEVMSSKGMGVIYINDSNGNRLRVNIPSDEERQEILSLFYRPYHKAIEGETQNLLDSFSRCLILDCHSFPSNPLPYELNQDPNRPDICLGTDPYHTPKRLTEIMEIFFAKYNLTTAINMPFEGTYVPMKFFRSDRRVYSLMVEINRKLYLDEDTGEKSDSFPDVKNIITDMVRCIVENIFQI